MIEHENLDEPAHLKLLEANIAAKKMVAGNGKAADVLDVDPRR